MGLLPKTSRTSSIASVHFWMLKYGSNFLVNLHFEISLTFHRNVSQGLKLNTIQPWYWLFEFKTNTASNHPMTCTSVHYSDTFLMHYLLLLDHLWIYLCFSFGFTYVFPLDLPMFFLWIYLCFSFGFLPTSSALDCYLSNYIENRNMFLQCGK